MKNQLSHHQYIIFHWELLWVFYFIYSSLCFAFAAPFSMHLHQSTQPAHHHTESRWVREQRPLVWRVMGDRSGDRQSREGRVRGCYCALLHPCRTVKGRMENWRGCGWSGRHKNWNRRREKRTGTNTTRRNIQEGPENEEEDTVRIDTESQNNQWWQRKQKINAYGLRNMMKHETGRESKEQGLGYVRQKREGGGGWEWKRSIHKGLPRKSQNNTPKISDTKVTREEGQVQHKGKTNSTGQP